jgi:hypothetical protein
LTAPATRKLACHSTTHAGHSTGFSASRLNSVVRLDLVLSRTDNISPVSLHDLWVDLSHHPYEYLVRRWNWKAGVISGMLRGGIFFTANLSAGREAAMGAMLAEFCYRILFSGGIGSLTEAMRKCEPAWAASLLASVLLPVLGHLVEFTVHYLRGTPRLGTSVAASIGFSALSTLFNLYAMRRGFLVVGGERRTLLQDMAALPRLLAGFVAGGPIALWKALRRHRER